MDNKNFFFHFSQNRFLGTKNQVFPLFLGDFKSDQAENFFGNTSTNSWGIYIFFSRYLLPIKSGRIRKIFEMLKCLRFSEILSILVLLPEVLGIFQKKKNIPHDWDPLPTVKISGQTDEICGIARGKTLGRFWTLWSLEVHEDEVWQICVYDNFCSTTRGLTTLKVSGIFA